MAFCNACQNTTFHPQGENPLDLLIAELHPSFSSLERQAQKRECNFCTAVYIAIKHQGLPIADPNQRVFLAIKYKEDTDDPEFDFIDEEIGQNDGDAPSDLFVYYGEKYICFRIQNRNAISRSAWYDEQAGRLTPMEDRGYINTSLGTASTDASTGSDANMSLIRSWIEKCAADHQICGNKPSGLSYTYPKRLLDVSRAEGESGIILLVSSEESNLQHLRPGYATLSHRWKPGNQSLDSSELKEKYVREGIPTKSLGSTFREAAITTQRLGLRYLWIDSLCILQYCRDDKTLEIPKMADYYQNADFNLAAATDRDNAGLWQERDGEANRPFTMPVTIHTPGLFRTTRQVNLSLAPILESVPSHLDARGWILQERIFPRRTIFFDPYWVSYECAEMAASESCPEGVLKNPESATAQVETDMATKLCRDATLSTMGGVLRVWHSEVSSGRILDKDARDDILNLWFRILAEYSTRALTFEDDRLNAISALAGRLSQILADEYVAGAWKNNILKSLWWASAGIEPHSTRLDGCDAPTWSWASLCSDSRGKRIDFSQPLSIEPWVQGLSLTWETRRPDKPGNAPQATLSLSGILLRGYVYQANGGGGERHDELVTITDRLREPPKAKQSPGLYDGVTGWLIRLSADHSGRRHTVIKHVDPDTSDAMSEGFFHLLPLAKCTNTPWEPGTLPPNFEPGDVFCLVLKESSRGYFRRVGSTLIKAQFLMTTFNRAVIII